MFKEVETEYVYLKQSPTAHLETNALNKPLASNRSGEVLEDGSNWITKINGYIDFPKFASFYIEPRMVVKENGKHFDLDMYRGYLKLGFKNIELQMGRDAQLWGFGHSGKIELSNQIEGMTMAKISNPHPTYLPWILKYLGAFKFSFFFSMLESERDYPNPTFWGSSFMFKPSKYIEWGISRTTMLGGKGSDSLGFWEYFMEALTGIRIYDTSKKDSGNGSAALYVLLKFPFLRNTQIYFDGYWEDLGGSGNIFTKGVFFTRDLAFITGLKIPRLNESGTFSLKTEFLKTTQITYRSTVYADGYTHNREIIGHHIGPDAWG